MKNLEKKDNLISGARNINNNNNNNNFSEASQFLNQNENFDFMGNAEILEQQRREMEEVLRKEEKEKKRKIEEEVRKKKEVFTIIIY